MFQCMVGPLAKGGPIVSRPSVVALSPSRFLTSCRSFAMGQTTTRSPFFPERLPRLPAIAGVRFAAAEAGIRYRGRQDLMVAVLDEGTTVAGVLTQSKTASAPVLLCREHLEGRAARLLVVN